MSTEQVPVATWFRPASRFGGLSDSMKFYLAPGIHGYVYNKRGLMPKDYTGPSWAAVVYDKPSRNFFNTEAEAKVFVEEKLAAHVYAAAKALGFTSDK